VASEKHELIIAKTVNSGTNQFVTWVIPNSETWRCFLMGAGVSDSPKVNAQLWEDHGGGGALLRWTQHHDQTQLPPGLFFDFVGNGVKKAGLVLLNGDSINLELSAFAWLEKL